MAGLYALRYLGWLPPWSRLRLTPAPLRRQIARRGHFTRDGGLVTLSIVDRLGRWLTATDQIPANVLRRELQCRIDVHEVHLTL